MPTVATRQVPVKRNVLLITLDQFRGDCFSTTRDTGVHTPGLHELARHGVHFERHYSQASPCSPGRASLYTGMYQMNHRVVANGTPLDRSFDNLALAARRAGYQPALFGYTDQAVDPRETTGAHDPRLQSYEGVLPGFDCVLDLTGDHRAWLDWLTTHGVDVSDGTLKMLSTENTRDEALSVSSFMTDRYFDWLETQQEGWFCHLSYLRPHSPYSAAGKFGTMYEPDAMDLPISPTVERHPLHQFLLDFWVTKAPTEDDALRRMKAQYFGMISEVDSQLVRIWDKLRERGEWENTVVIVSSDHGEMMGDHGLKEKVGYWEQSYHIPCVIRDPRHSSSHGTTVTSLQKTSTSSQLCVNYSTFLCRLNVTGTHCLLSFRVKSLRSGEQLPHGNLTGVHICWTGKHKSGHGRSRNVRSSRFALTLMRWFNSQMERVSASILRPTRRGEQRPPTRQ